MTFDETIPPPKKRRLWLWLGVLPAVVILSLIVGIIVSLKVFVDRRLAAAIAAADRDDPNWRTDDLLEHREPIPDAENSALVAARALEFVSEGWPVGRAAPGEMRPLPTPTSIAFDRVVETPDDRLLAGDVAASLRDALAEIPKAVEIARSVADYPRGRYEIAFAPVCFDTPLPHLRPARALARLLRVDAALRAQDGDLDGSLETCRASVCVGRSIGDEPFLISQLVRIAIVLDAVKAAGRTLAQGEPGDRALARLQEILDDERKCPLMTHALKGERASLDDFLAKLGTGEIIATDGAERFVWTAESGRPRGLVLPWYKLMFANQRAIMLEWMTDAADIARLPDAEHFRRWDLWDARLARQKGSRYNNYTGLIPTLFAPAMPSFSEALARYHCTLGSMVVLIAAERHRHKTGTWPASTSDIARDILPNPPLDPFFSGPIRLEHRDGQHFAYSVGYNRSDDHGSFDVIRWRRGPFDVGTSAWDVDQRRRPPGGELPEDVFARER